MPSLNIRGMAGDAKMEVSKTSAFNDLSTSKDQKFQTYQQSGTPVIQKPKATKLEPIFTFKITLSPYGIQHLANSIPPCPKKVALRAEKQLNPFLTN